MDTEYIRVYLGCTLSVKLYSTEQYTKLIFTSTQFYIELGELFRL